MAKISYNRGTTFTFTHVYQKGGIPSSDGIELFFTVKKSVDNDISDSAAILKKNITMTSSQTTVQINPGDVPDSASKGKYVADFKIVEAWGPPPVIYPGGSFDFELDVTSTNRISLS